MTPNQGDTVVWHDHLSAMAVHLLDLYTLNQDAAVGDHVRY